MTERPKEPRRPPKPAPTAEQGRGPKPPVDRPAKGEASKGDDIRRIERFRER